MQKKKRKIPFIDKLFKTVINKMSRTYSEEISNKTSYTLMRQVGVKRKNEFIVSVLTGNNRKRISLVTN